MQGSCQVQMEKLFTSNNFSIIYQYLPTAVDKSRTKLYWKCQILTSLFKGFLLFLCFKHSSSIIQNRELTHSQTLLITTHSPQIHKILPHPWAKGIHGPAHKKNKQKNNESEKLHVPNIPNETPDFSKVCLGNKMLMLQLKIELMKQEIKVIPQNLELLHTYSQ